MTAEKTGTSVLAQLTADVMAEKKSEARKLTPVAGETGGSTFPLERALIPNDTGLFMSNETLHAHAKQLRKFAADAIAIADGLDALLSESSNPEDVVDINAARKALEAKADAKFRADFAAKQAEAQAKVFAPTESLDDDGQETYTDFGWLCETHGKAVEKISAKTARKFIGCPDCNAFKR